jgi:NAD(P)-dependent dehydrogenase (short-subunit alcohol dehydrogenase family)
MADSKIALITGAGSGIGRACAIALAKEGWTVVLAGRRADALDETIAEAGEGAKMLAVPSDVSDPAQVKALFAKTKETYGRLDLLFNNAGVGAPPLPLEELGFAQWRAALDTNLTGAFLCTQQAFRLMKQQTPRGGRIVNNGSISAYAPRPRSAPYTASKHGITGLTKAAALDGRAYDIAVGQLDIGNAHTEMTEPMRAGVPQADGAVRPEPVMDVRHVADALLHMARLPLEANVLFMTVMATKMPFVGRG